MDREEIRALLYSYPLKAVVSAADSFILAELLTRHPRAQEKIGCGIDYFSIDRGGYGTRCFYIHRTDGTKTDFSFLRCFQFSRKDFPAAARRAIEGQIFEFRLTLPEVFDCPVNGTPLTRNTAHIDHAPPYTFRQIVNTFIALNNIPVESVSYDRSGIGVSFQGSSLKTLFSLYHKKHAVLRGISREANLSLSKI